MAVSINLLPDIKQQRLQAKRRKRNLTLVAITIIIVGVAMPVLAGGVLGGQQLLLNNARNNNKKGIEELTSIEGLDEAITAQTQLDTIYDLRNNGEDFNGFLNTLEKAVSPNARLTSITISEDGTMELSGVTADVDSVNVLVKSLSSYTPAGLNLDKFDTQRQTFIDNIAVTSIDPEDDDGVTFTIEAIFNFGLLEELAAEDNFDEQTDDEEDNDVDPFEGGSN